MGTSLADLTDFRRLLRQCLTDSDFLSELVDNGLDFWALAPANTPFAWYGDVADIPTGWSVLTEADGRYIIGSSSAAGTLGGSSAALTHTGTAVADHVFTQPSQHAAGTTGTNGAITTVNEGGGAPVAINTTGHSHSTPALSHTGGAVDAHTVTQPGSHARADINPLSLSFIWIIKDS